MRYIVLVLFATGLLSCGDASSPTTPTPTPTPSPQPTRTVLVEGTFIELRPVTYYQVTFTTTEAGILDFTVDWTFAENAIWIFLGQGACTDSQIQAQQCPYLLLSLVATPKPRVLTLSAPPGTYSLLISNRGPGVESGVYRVGLTR